MKTELTTETKANDPFKSRSFMKFFRSRIQYLKECRRYGTAINYQRAMHSLEKYLKGKDVTFNNIDISFVGEYEEWLMKQGLVRNSVSFHMRILRAVYNNGVRKGMSKQKYPFLYVYTGIDKTRKRGVGEDIVTGLVSLNVGESTDLVLTRDMFLFSLYTRGMAFVDMAYLKKSDCEYDTLTYVRKKSKSVLNIHIEKEIKAIIKKYEKENADSPYIFPILKATGEEENHKLYLRALSLYNHRLKKLAELMGVKVSLSSYTSRHTWANLLYKMEVPVSVISAGLGHRSEQTTRIYLASLDSKEIDKANRMMMEKVIGEANSR